MDLMGYLGFHMANEDRKIRRVVNVVDFNVPNDGIRDAGFNLQEALDHFKTVKNDKGINILYFPPGTYLIKSSTLRIRSNTHILLHPHAIIKRAHTGNALFLTENENRAGTGYNASENITLEGGTIDGGSKDGFTNACTLFATFHSKNVRVKNVTFQNLNDWHMVEINSSQNVVIEDCVFDGYGTATTGTEMLQVDYAWKDGFPWDYLPGEGQTNPSYDDTHTKDVYIRNCIFKNGVTAIGNHGAKELMYYYNINIDNCYFENMRDYAIRMINWRNANVRNCYFTDCFGGIHATTVVNTPSRDIRIMGNTFLNFKADAEAKGIRIVGADVFSWVGSMTISDNYMDKAGKHGMELIRVYYSNITNNSILGSRQAGLWALGGSNNNIMHNVIRSNNSSGTTGQQDIKIGFFGAVSTDKFNVQHNDLGSIGFDTCNGLFVKNNMLTGVFNQNNSNLQYKDNLINGVMQNA